MSTTRPANIQETDDEREFREFQEWKRFKELKAQNKPQLSPTPHEKLTLESLNKKTSALQDYISRMFKEWTSRLTPEEKALAKDIVKDVFWLIKNYKILQEHSEKRIEHSEKKIEHLKAAAEAKAEANIRAVKIYLDIYGKLSSCSPTENNENE
jgi:hypothetical protein